MANDDHIAQLMKGVVAWNAWRKENPGIRPDLMESDLRRADLHGAELDGANLRGANLREANLSEANLSQADLTHARLSGNLRKANLSHASLVEADLDGANLSGANLRGANLDGASLRRADLDGANLQANLRGANLSQANLRGADLDGANLREANLRWATLSGANLTWATLSGANLTRATLNAANLSGADLQAVTLVDTDLTDADLTGCRVYGVSAWRLKLEGAKQKNLVITREQQKLVITPGQRNRLTPREDEPTVTVDNIEVAQFVYLLLNNQKIRDIIDTIGKKGVLLLGRFTEGRIEILERLREKLRDLGFVPMVFNFDKPETKNFTETVRLLANLSRFVIVDITNPRSTPLELQAAVPDYMVPFAPILQEGEKAFAMFEDLQNQYDWVLDVIVYPSVDRLIEVLKEEIIRPAEAKFDELLTRRTGGLRTKKV